MAAAAHELAVHLSIVNSTAQVDSEFVGRGGHASTSRARGVNPAGPASCTAACATAGLTCSEDALAAHTDEVTYHYIIKSTFLLS